MEFQGAAYNYLYFLYAHGQDSYLYIFNILETRGYNPTNPVCSWLVIGKGGWKGRVVGVTYTETAG